MNLENRTVLITGPMSRSIAEGWSNGVAKALERQQAAFVPENMTKAG
jgi:hypothetical protein